MALAAVTAAVGCRVSLGDDKIYSCKSSDDCAGDGFSCTAPPGGVGRCCRPSGAETCNGLDDDCNGKVDDVTQLEVCNGVDDNCDGQIDEGFNLQNSSFNCGACGAACDAGTFCSAGQCARFGELSCSDGLDDDEDGKTDCEDPDCAFKSCGPGCQCFGGQKAERDCVNQADDDGDSKVDCADQDCGGASCAQDGGFGCTCAVFAKKETDCRDGEDNDGDSATDCADSDCLSELCQADPSTYRCAANLACSCNAAGTVPELGALLCRDRIDNDCDGLLDCAEADCDTLGCNPDGGAGCRCEFGERTETNCADRVDNDEDGKTDCADVSPDGGGECPFATACTYLSGGGTPKNGSCAADRTCK